MVRRIFKSLSSVVTKIKISLIDGYKKNREFNGRLYSSAAEHGGLSA